MHRLLILIAFVAASCSTRSIDCEQMTSTCVYIQFGFSDCTPDDGKWDHVRTDTSIMVVNGCADEIEAQFYEQQAETQTSGGTAQSRKFAAEYPSTCNCQ